MEASEAKPDVPRSTTRPRYSRLNSLEDVRRNLARALRAAEKVGRRKPGDEKTLDEEKLELDRFRALVSGYRALAEMFAGVEMERRLAALEERAAKGAH